MRGLSDYVLKIKVYFEPVFDEIPWTITHGKMRNFGPFQMGDLSMPSERAPSEIIKLLKMDNQNSSYRAN